MANQVHSYPMIDAGIVGCSIGGTGMMGTTYSGTGNWDVYCKTDSGMNYNSKYLS